jgi:glycosyltransferase involved in cell wall biosynthesis
VDRSQIGIIIPAFNESQNIKSVIESIMPLGIPIVVDDGSTDDTSAVAKNLGAIVFQHPKNLGYDKALKSGFDTVDDLGLEYAITMDADGQHAAIDILKVIDHLAEADIVIGVRKKKARISESIFAFFTYRSFGILDPLCGMKGYKMVSSRKYNKILDYKSIGTQPLLEGLNAGLTIDQVKLAHSKDRIGKSKLGGSIRSNASIFLSLIRAWKRYF